MGPPLPLSHSVPSSSEKTSKQKQNNQFDDSSSRTALSLCRLVRPHRNPAHRGVNTTTSLFVCLDKAGAVSSSPPLGLKMARVGSHHCGAFLIYCTHTHISG